MTNWKAIAERLGRAAIEFRDHPGFPEFHLKELIEALDAARKAGADIPPDDDGMDWTILYHRSQRDPPHLQP